DSRDSIDCPGRPMEQRWLVHRDCPVLDRKKHMSLLDHLLDEHALDRFVSAAHVTRADPIERQCGDDDADDGYRAERPASRTHWIPIRRDRSGKFLVGGFVTDHSRATSPAIQISSRRGEIRAWRRTCPPDLHWCRRTRT